MIRTTNDGNKKVRRFKNKILCDLTSNEQPAYRQASNQQPKKQQLKTTYYEH